MSNEFQWSVPKIVDHCGIHSDISTSLATCLSSAILIAIVRRAWGAVDTARQDFAFDERHLEPKPSCASGHSQR